jgi:hypothetical protein
MRQYRVNNRLTMPTIQLHNLTQKPKKRHNSDGTTTDCVEFCVEVTNSGEDSEEETVSFYRVFVPADGARPSAPALKRLFCTDGPKKVPPRIVKQHGSTDGREWFCCLYCGPLDDDEEGTEGQGRILLWAEVGKPAGKGDPVGVGKGEEYTNTPLHK